LLSCGDLTVASNVARLLCSILIKTDGASVSAKSRSGLHTHCGNCPGRNLLGNVAYLTEVLAYLVAHLLNALQLLRCCAFMLLQPGKIGCIVLFSLLKLVCHLDNVVNFLAHSLNLLLQLIDLIHWYTSLEFYILHILYYASKAY